MHFQVTSESWECFFFLFSSWSLDTSVIRPFSSLAVSLCLFGVLFLLSFWPTRALPRSGFCLSKEEEEEEEKEEEEEEEKEKEEED